MIVTASEDITGAATAAEHVAKVHAALAEFLRAGRTLPEIDHFVGETIRDLGGKSAFLHYKIPGHPPFPSQSCLSLNDCIVHGTHTMTQEPLRPGDVLSVDIGVVHQGWIGDAAWTYAIEDASDEAKKLMECGVESLRRGVDAMQTGRPLVDWARVVQHCAEQEYGFKMIRGLGGHGYGRKLHGPPFISNVMPSYPGEWPDAFTRFEPGMLIAVEPMIAVGTPQIRTQKRQWPIHTPDGSLAVHYEADVLITEDGPRNLTEAMWDLPMIVG